MGREKEGEKIRSRKLRGWLWASGFSLRYIRPGSIGTKTTLAKAKTKIAKLLLSP